MDTVTVSCCQNIGIYSLKRYGKPLIKTPKQEMHLLPFGVAVGL